MIKNKTSRQIKNERMLDFYRYYEKEISPLIEKYEGERKIRAVIFTVIAIFATCFLATYIYHLLFFPLIVVGLVLYAVVMLISYRFITRGLQNKIKKEVLQKLICSLGNINWIPEKNLIDNEMLRQSELFSTYNTRINDDTFEGEYNGLSFKISETNLTQVSGSGRNRRVDRVFNGVIILIDSNKTTNSKTIIATKGDQNIRNNATGTIATIFSSIVIIVLGYLLEDTFKIGIGIFLLIVFSLLALCQKIDNEKEMSSMTLEDPEFNKKYNAYSQDQIEGRYLITTSFIERFKNLHTAFGTTKAKCAFVRDKIMFALSTNKNLFELSEGIFCSLKNPKQTKVFYDEISAIYDIIDYFKLDTKIGL